MPLIVAAFLALCLINNIALPVFEAPDESSHFIYADYIATHKRLPDLNGVLPAHEVIQPPLYYSLVAFVISPFDRSDLKALTQLNTDWFDKDLNADFMSVRGQHVHAEAERWPWRGTIWAVHAARFVSALLGAATVVFVYLIAKNVFVRDSGFDTAGIPDPRSSIPIFCAALVAFNPKFVHVSSIVSNDVAITLACTVALWWMLRIANAELRIKQGGRSGLPFSILGGLIGLAVLCKLQGLALFAPALALVLMPFVFGMKLSEGTDRLTWIASRAASLLAGFVLVAGWYFVYNIARYGNPLAWAQVQAANATLVRQPPLDLAQIVATVPLWFSTYWGSLGVKLEFPDWINIVFAVALALAIVGCGVAVARGLPNVNRRALLVLVLAEIAILALYVAWLRSYIATENSRLIFPGIAPVVVAVVLGWTTIVPRRAHSAAAVAVGTGMAALSLAAPFTTIAPAYATPDVMSRDEWVTRYGVPNTGGVATFGGDIRLMHAHLDRKRVKPGETIGVTLLWGGVRPMRQSYRVVLEALDADDELIGRRLFIPFGGRFATQRWQPDMFFEDEYALPIDATARRGVARVQLSVFAQYPTPGLLPVDGAAGNTFLIDRIKVDAPSVLPTTLDAQVIATFGDMMHLDRARVNAGADVNDVVLDWRVGKPPDKDYTLFIHVLGADGKLIAQQDAQPFGGQYPTGLWERDERVRDVRAMTVPSEARQLGIGWYDPRTGQRLPARKADGSAWPDDVVIIDVR